MRPTPSEKQRGPQSLPLRMENFGGAGKPESSKHFSAEIAAFASLWSVILGKRGLVFNSLTFSCYLASILCKNAEMPHFRAAFLLCIFFINTFWSEWGDSNARSLEPKSSAIPTSLHPDIQFLPLYHGERENQSFFCLWSFMWSKPLLYRFRQSVEIPQTQVSQGFAAFRLTLSRIPPRHSQITRAANYATFGHRYFSRPGAFFPTYVRQYTLRSAALALWHHLLLDRGQHDGFILYLSILPVSPPKSSLFASGRYVGKAARRLWGLRTA